MALNLRKKKPMVRGTLPGKTAPPLVKGPQGRLSTGKIPKVSQVKPPKGPLHSATPSPVSIVTPGAPGATQPGPPVTPPPESPETMGLRQIAERDWAQSQMEKQNALYQAALRYGDEDLIATYGAPIASVANPNSQINQIERAKAESSRAQQEAANSIGTFFSGRHGQAQADVSNEAARNMSAAFREFQDLFDAEQRDSITARAKYDDAHAQADLQDVRDNAARDHGNGKNPYRKVTGGPKKPKMAEGLLNPPKMSKGLLNPGPKMSKGLVNPGKKKKKGKK